MFVDLHIHTRFSDSTLTTEDIVLKSKSNDVKLISVTDHNTVEAYNDLKVLCKTHDISLIQGVEIDCLMGDKYVHALGYGFDISNKELLNMLYMCKSSIKHKDDTLIFNMSKDYDIDLDDYESWLSPPEIGGYKNSNFLLHKGILEKITDYFKIDKKYSLSILDIGLPQLNDVSTILNNAGGVCVLAHPFDRLDKNNFINELNIAVKNGIQGLECYYPSHDEITTKLLIEFCNYNDLIITGGSDEHGCFNKVINDVIYGISEIKISYADLNLKNII